MGGAEDCRMTASLQPAERIVVIGHGMVGHRFCERLVALDTARRYRLVVFCEEPRAAYDRVGLTSFFAHRDAERLMLARLEWYAEHGVDVYLAERAVAIDRQQRVVRSERGQQAGYDYVVLATGSYPFVPQVPGVQQRGVFLYRTLEDLQQILDYAPRVRRCAVLGGGLLGLEAAKAALDLGLETHVIEFAPRLMPRQLDDTAAQLLAARIRALGVQVHLSKTTRQVLGSGSVEGLLFEDGTSLSVEMVIVSAGIRPRDELARRCGLDVDARGGVIVDDRLRTSDPRVFAIGEVAWHRGMVYGLVSPGYEMAEIAAANLTGGDCRFAGADLSTRLKLLGVDVASFGEYEAPSERAVPLVHHDPIAGVYRKLLFNPDGTRLLGGMLVGDASDYGKLLSLVRGQQTLSCPPAALVVPPGTAAPTAPATREQDDLLCSCHQVTRGAICRAISEHHLATLAQLKQATRAATGCGGCLPEVARLLEQELARAGKAASPRLCEHFAYTRQELFQITKIKGYKTFAELLANHGTGAGCEVCKPAVASILASLHNEFVLAEPHLGLQDTNDRFLANMQRGGLYSVVPRVPGGEITPDQLMALGRVAKKYGLYTKITGGQRVDLFGAQLHQLPDIWEELIAAGLESGHAYGKTMRTVKSCVGSTWCRYGVQDSVGFAIRIERRYRGLRAPHKLKAAVSGCVRECAEAQSKDFGLIATERGYNLYVCGNGGARPRHADLLAADLDEETAIRYIDRFLMYYIHTADKLTRTSVWLENMPGGIEYLRAVIVEDKLRLAAELERQMQALVDSYQCEWTAVVRDPQRRRLFRQFVNTDETELGIELVHERGQCRPADWPRGEPPVYQLSLPMEQPHACSAGCSQHAVPNSTAATAAAAQTSGACAHVLPDAQICPPSTTAGCMEDAAVPSASHNGRLRPHDGERVAAAIGQGHRTARRLVPTRDTQPAWVTVGRVEDFPPDGGAAVKYGKVQIAVFRFQTLGRWYACQNMCPHRNAFVLSRGILGTHEDEPKVACPLHKRTYSLQSGNCLSGQPHSIKVFPVRVVGDEVQLLLPPQEQLDALLATELHAIRAQGRMCGQT